MHMAGQITFESGGTLMTEEARFPDPEKEKPTGNLPRKACRNCIHMPVCAIFRAVAGALAPFAGEKNDGPVKPYGIANSCEAYLEGPARIEVILDKKEAKA